MQNQTVARRYANAILSLAKERGAVDEVGRDLGAAAAAIGGDDESAPFLHVARRQPREEARRVRACAVRLRRSRAPCGPVVDSQAPRGIARADGAEYEKLALADSGRERLQIASARSLAGRARRIVTASHACIRSRLKSNRTSIPRSWAACDHDGDRRIDCHDRRMPR